MLRKAEFYPQITQISQIGGGTKVTDFAARLGGGGLNDAPLLRAMRQATP